jgi:transketolase
MAMIDAAMMGAGAGTGAAVDAPFGRALLAVAEDRPEIVGLSADLSKYTDIGPFRDRYPERFFQMGMAEANMMGVAGGLARVGYVPFVTTYGVFASRRAFDQVAMSIALGRANVKIVAFLPGLTTPGGPTHQAIEDLALMRALPNMVVIDPADARELEQAVHGVAAYDGPVYLRGLRGTVPVILPPDYRFEIGKARLLRGDGEGEADLGIVSTGIMTERALQAADLLAAEGTRVAVLHASTLKPFDAEAVVHLARRVKALVSVENGTVVGGLAGAVSETLARAGNAPPLLPLGVQDHFPVAGSLDYLLERYGLTPDAIGSAARAALATLALAEG